MEPLAVAVVIPVLDEAASIAAVITEILRDVVREIIVVDGGSSDGTAEVAAAAGARVIVPGQPGYGEERAAKIKRRRNRDRRPSKPAELEAG
jgi:glycosyltransferase involved in cell wall biosynthesis